MDATQSEGKLNTVRRLPLSLALSHEGRGDFFEIANASGVRREKQKSEVTTKN